MHTATENTPRVETPGPRRRGKAEQILEGCRRLSSRQKPGQSFSLREIASECGVDARAIQFIEQKALYHVAQKLAAHRGLLADIFDGAKVTEVFAGLRKDPYNSKEPRARRTTVRWKTFKITRATEAEVDHAFRRVFEKRGLPVPAVSTVLPPRLPKP